MPGLRMLLACLLLAAGIPADAVSTECRGADNAEAYHYVWHLRGGLSWIAGFVFPTSGVADLRSATDATSRQVHSELLIRPDQGKSGYYQYQSDMEPSGARTLKSFHGYSWGSKSRKEQTWFEYPKLLAHLHKETPGKLEDRTKPISSTTMRDVLTAIYYLRENALRINGPVTAVIYSDGTEYPVMFRPIFRKTFQLNRQNVEALGFEIVDGPGGKKWPGGIRVWISNDSRRIPFRIEIRESMASLELSLETIQSCGFMHAT